MRRKQNLIELSSEVILFECDRELKSPLKTEIIAVDSESSKKPRFCYLCLCLSENTQPLFEESSKKVLENIRNEFQIEPIQDEVIPDQICTCCVGKIDAFISFRQKVHENHQKFQLEVEGAKDVTVLEPNIKICEDDDNYVEETMETRQSTRSLSSSSTPKLIESDDESEMTDSELHSEASGSIDMKEDDENMESEEKDDEYDVLLRNFFTLECTRCVETFPRFHALRRHALNKHKLNRISIKCYQSDCNVYFGQRHKLIDHLRSHGVIPPLTNYHCPYCAKGFEYLNALKIHLKTDTCTPLLNEMFECHYCATLFSTRTRLQKHFHRIHGYEMFALSSKHKCNRCKKKYTSKKSLRTHMKIYHKQIRGEKSLICEICAKTFVTNSALSVHFKAAHQTQEKVTCYLCGQKLKNKSILKAHLRRTHHSKPLKCEICSKELRNRETLISHMKHVHEAPKFICPECGKAFSVREKLVEHKTIHGVGGDLYKCEWCNKTFNFSSSKSFHKKTQHPIEWQQSRDETYKWTRKSKENKD